MSVDLDELDRLRAEATPGEWKLLTIASADGISERLYAEDGASRIDLAHIPMVWPKHGRLIVALVNAYPAMAAELRELRVKVVRDHVPVPVSEIIHRLEGEAGNTDTDPRWVAATALRRMAGWETRTLMCQIDESEPIVRTRGPK